MIWDNDTFVHDVCGRYDPATLLHFREVYQYQIAKFQPATIRWFKDAPFSKFLCL
jgi:hypothetical protein